MIKLLVMLNKLINL